MQDVIYLAFMCALVGVAALFVIGCDKLIGSDEEAIAAEGMHADDEVPETGPEPEREMAA